MVAGRALEPLPFDGRLLGDAFGWFARRSRSSRCSAA